MIIRVLNESKVKKVNYQPLNDFLANFWELRRDTRCISWKMRSA